MSHECQMSRTFNDPSDYLSFGKKKSMQHLRPGLYTDILGIIFYAMTRHKKQMLIEHATLF